MHIKIISAGAGSGKTHRLTQELVTLIGGGAIRPSGIFATTFTNKAAAELQERVRVTLLKKGYVQAAEELQQALIGTVHSLGGRLLQRFAFEAGVSPEVSILAKEDQSSIFNNALSTILTDERTQRINDAALRFIARVDEEEKIDWRKEVYIITDLARNNNLTISQLEESKEKSITSLLAHFDAPSTQSAAYWATQLQHLLTQTISDIEANTADQTKDTLSTVVELKTLVFDLQNRGYLPWAKWGKLAHLKVGAKSRELVADIKELAHGVGAHPQLHADVRDYITQLFDIAKDALKEYDDYKKRRGLIDYTDMEVSVFSLLEDARVQEVLRDEIDLLLVDEFQDTSPIQLAIFLKLAKLAKTAIWVGDPKQSIYGFRGAEPQLMHAIVETLGGVKPEDILDTSYRSRQELVHLANAIFTHAFAELPPEQVALKARLPKAQEPAPLSPAILHWHFECTDKGRISKGWIAGCLAQNIYELLQKPYYIIPKGEKEPRLLRAGDIAILCRTNENCITVAEALSQFGIQAAIAQKGLLSTIEVNLIVACLRYLLNRYDSLAAAEIMHLATQHSLQSILDDRLQFLEAAKEHQLPEHKWGQEHPILRQLHDLRPQIVELSSAELLNLVIERLQLPRYLLPYGQLAQRLNNIDQLRKLVLQYEDAAMRLQSAASVGGFLVWLSDLKRAGADPQAAFVSPDAVNILTYHSSKGLEFPMTICHQLDASVRDNLWGAAIVDERERIDLQDILAKRWIRYWVNPLGSYLKHTAMGERIANSPAQQEANKKALAEEVRVMYVGITRARDYLVLPTSANGSGFLNRVCQVFDTKLILDENTNDTPWVWEGEVITKATYVRQQGKQFDYPTVTSDTVVYYW